jgi:hypothetical protein
VNLKTDATGDENRLSAVSKKRVPRRHADPPDIYQVVVTCRDENEQKRLFQQLRKKYRVRLLIL